VAIESLFHNVAQEAGITFAVPEKRAGEDTVELLPDTYRVNCGFRR